MTIRDADRIKDKLEVSLDGRQVFFLFFGGAVVACLVFVLGVMVGKRLEGRERVARRAATSAVIDPLAALDELGADERAAGASDQLDFPTALSGADKAGARALDLPPGRSYAPEATSALVAAQQAAAHLAHNKPESRTRFTLQISSFQDRSEADALVAKLSGAGYQPVVTMSNVPERGIFFRVRIGDYGSRDDALAAKEVFEKKEHIIAYVTRQ